MKNLLFSLLLICPSVQAMAQTIDSPASYIDGDFSNTVEDSDEDIGNAESMGRTVGPYILSGAVNAAMFPFVRNVGSSAIFGAATAAPPLSEAGSDVFGAYGRYIDKTGQNPFFPSPFSPPPGPSKSMGEALSDAWGKFETWRSQ